MNNKSERFSEKINLSEKLSDDVYIRANKEELLCWIVKPIKFTE